MTSGVVSHFLGDKLRANKSSIEGEEEEEEEERSGSGSKGRDISAITGINQNKTNYLLPTIDNLNKFATNPAKVYEELRTARTNNNNINERGSLLSLSSSLPANGRKVFLAKFRPPKRAKSLNSSSNINSDSNLNSNSNSNITKGKQQQIKAREWCKRLLAGAYKQIEAKVVVVRSRKISSSSIYNINSKSSSSSSSSSRKNKFIKPMIGNEMKSNDADRLVTSNTQSQIKLEQEQQEQRRRLEQANNVAGSAPASGSGSTNKSGSSRHLISELSWRLVKRCTKAKVVQFATRASGCGYKQQAVAATENSGGSGGSGGSSSNNNSGDLYKTTTAVAENSISIKDNDKKVQASETKPKESGSFKQATSGGLSFAKSFARRRRKIESDLKQRQELLTSCSDSDNSGAGGNLLASSSSMAATSPFNTTSTLQASHLNQSSIAAKSVTNNTITTLPPTLPLTKTTTITGGSIKQPELELLQHQHQHQQPIELGQLSGGKLGGINNSSVSTITSNDTTPGLVCCQFCQEHCQEVDNSLLESGCFVSSSLAVGGSQSCGLTNCSDSITTQHSSTSSSSTSSSSSSSSPSSPSTTSSHPPSSSSTTYNSNSTYNEPSSVVEQYRKHHHHQNHQQQQQQKLVVKGSAEATTATDSNQRGLSGFSINDQQSEISEHFIEKLSLPKATAPALLSTSAMILDTNNQEVVADQKVAPKSKSSTSIFSKITTNISNNSSNNNNNQEAGSNNNKKKQGSFLSRARESTINLSSLANVTRTFGYSASVGNLWSSHSQQRRELAELSGDSPQANVKPLDYVAQAAFDSNTFASFHINDDDEPQIGCEKAIPIVVQSATTQTTTTNNTTTIASNNNNNVNNNNKLSAPVEPQQQQHQQHKLSTKEKEWRQKEAEKMEKLRLLVSYLKSGRSTDILPINKTTSACSNPQNFAVWIDNEVNSLINDLEVKSQLMKSGKDHVKGGKLKWLSPSSRRNSSGCHST